MTKGGIYWLGTHGKTVILDTKLKKVLKILSGGLKTTNSMNIVYLGVGGIIPVPPAEIAFGTERYIYNLTDNPWRVGCQVAVIGIKGGVQHEERRQEANVNERRNANRGQSQ